MDQVEAPGLIVVEVAALNLRRRVEVDSESH